MLRSGYFSRAVVLASFVLGFLAMLVGGATAQDARPAYGGVVDYARVFNPEERRALEVVAGRIARHMDVDFFVASVDDRAANWAWRFQTNRQMADRVFDNVKAAADDHFRGKKDLAVLLVFKAMPVLHLKTDNDDLARTLLFNNFYSGAKGAFGRVRDVTRNETWHDASMRYLETFARTVAATGRPSKVQEAGYWLFDEHALLSSRNFVEYLGVEWAFAKQRDLTETTIRTTGLEGWVAYLVAFTLLYLLVKIAVEVVPVAMAAFIGHASGNAVAPATIWPWLRTLANSLEPFLVGPLLVVAFSIAHGDLENLVYLAQVVRDANLAGLSAKTSQADLVTFLDWSKAISGAMADLPWPALVAAALVILGLDAVNIKRSMYRELQDRLAARASGLTGVISPALRAIAWSRFLGAAGIKLVKSAVLVASLFVFPGLLQLIFIVTDVAVRLVFLPRAAGKSAAEPEPARASLPAPVLALSHQPAFNQHRGKRP